MTRTLRFPAILLSAAFIAAACSGGGEAAAVLRRRPSRVRAQAVARAAGRSPAARLARINVLSLWGGSEEEAFKKVLATSPRRRAGASSTRRPPDVLDTLQSRITGGNPPDIAIIPGIGFLRRFAKDGSLKKISDLGVDAST
jgi:ABC-type glycerol-3-phosphate transport system substrate-binding protein